MIWYRPRDDQQPNVRRFCAVPLDLCNFGSIWKLKETVMRLQWCANFTLEETQTCKGWAFDLLLLNQLVKYVKHRNITIWTLFQTLFTLVLGDGTSHHMKPLARLLPCQATGWRRWRTHTVSWTSSFDLIQRNNKKMQLKNGTDWKATKNENCWNGMKMTFEHGCGLSLRLP